MIDDNTIGDAARNPGDETPGSVVRTGVRATAKKAARKVAKKTAKKAAKKVVKKAAKKTAGAGGRSGDGRARKKTAEKAAKPAAATPTVPEAIAPDVATAGPAASGTAARETAPPETSASDAAAASGIVPSGAATPETVADGPPSAAKRALPADAARRIGPTHPGAHMTGAESEDIVGLGGFLALWGPLIIVGFLVLVFWGGDEREVATGERPRCLTGACIGHGARGSGNGGAASLRSGARTGRRRARAGIRRSRRLPAPRGFAGSGGLDGFGGRLARTTGALSHPGIP